MPWVRYNKLIHDSQLPTAVVAYDTQMNVFMAQCLSKILSVTQIKGERLGFDIYFKTALQSEEETLISTERKMVKAGLCWCDAFVVLETIFCASYSHEHAQKKLVYFSCHQL